MLIDNHGRIIEYLRVSVTDRCNLRCFYCMPEKGIDFVERDELLSFEELNRLCQIFVGLGIKKIRITGGEPFVRKGLIGFLKTVNEIPGLAELSITTNGTQSSSQINEMMIMGIKSVNLSLDTLNKDRFIQITRRDEFEKVYRTLQLLIESPLELKVNMVVMEGLNTEDILPMLKLTEDNAVSVRFIEQMPFNGSAESFQLNWDFPKILSHIKSAYPDAIKLMDKPGSTSYNYSIPGFKGSFGIIAAHTRSFCGSCNRLRLTPLGKLQTCLYGQATLDLKELMRSGAADQEIIFAIKEEVNSRFENGFEAEVSRKKTIWTSMASIGG